MNNDKKSQKNNTQDFSPFIALGDPVLGDPEKKTLCDVIDSGWLTMGDRVATFEKDFATLHGVSDAVAVNSCTAALHLCLEALGVGDGDEVLIPSLTFVATANAVLYSGAKPVFVDINNISSPHISLDDAATKITSATKAVIVMHYGGYTVDLPAWRKFADDHNLLLIEDAAHAPAVRLVGQLSDAAAFSFFTNKNMTTSEGGMVVARNAEVLNKIRLKRSHGMTSSTLDRQRGHAFSYDVITLGYNYRMDELRAAMGLVQLARLPSFNRQRKVLTNHYRQVFQINLSEVSLPFTTNHETSAHLLPVILPEYSNRQDIMSQLRRAGVQSSIHYPPIHHFSFYKKLTPDVTLPHTEEFCSRVITLPLHPALSKSDVEYVVDTLTQAL